MHLFGLVALGYMWCLIAQAAYAKGAGPTAPATQWRRKSSPGAFSRSACCPARRRISPASQAGAEHDGVAGGGFLGARAPRSIPWIWTIFCTAIVQGSLVIDARRLNEMPGKETPCPTPSSSTRSYTSRPGKADGALHEVTSLDLASQALDAIKSRNDLDPELVDDVVLGWSIRSAKPAAISRGPRC